MAAAIPVLRKRRITGFTLVELMTVLAVVAVLAAIAAPSFRSMMANERIRGASLDLVSNLTLTRSEAIKRNTNVQIVSASGNGSWHNGWQVESTAGNPAVTDVIAVQQAYPGVSITASTISQPNQTAASISSVSYNRSGRLTNSGVRFEVIDARAGASSKSRCITIDATGMPISKAGAC